MHIRTAAVTVALLAAALTGCSSGATTSAAKATPAPSPSPAATRTYDVHDCKAVLERHYDADQPHDASTDPECQGLTRPEYVKVVGEVLAGREDEIMGDAADHVAWDEAWKQTDAAQQQLVCGRLKDEGAVAVGQEMMDTADDPDGDQIKMVQYFLDEKC